MPHATTETTTTMANGTSPTSKSSSKFLTHLTQYPVVSDGVNTFQNHPYGKKSLEIADGVYSKYGKAVEPYLEKPYGYAKPYVAKADELADSGLSHVDERFPIVKEETGSLVEKGKGVVWWPVATVGQGRDYVMGTWNDEYQKTLNHNSRSPGLSTSFMALISTELRIASDFFQAVADFLGPKYEESKAKANDLAADGQQLLAEGKETAQQYQAAAADKVQEFGQEGEKKVEEVKKNGGEKVEQGKKEAQRAQAEAGKRVQGQK